tara:strand:- start:312 stop:2033 length:1722 start_codon:yes stop_codon:yes gene_type:complete
MGLKSYFFRIFEEAKKVEADAPGNFPEKIYIPGGYDPLKDEFLITVGNLAGFATQGEVTPLQPKLGEESVEEPTSGFDGFEDDIDDTDTEDPTEETEQAAVVFSPSDGFNITTESIGGSFEGGLLETGWFIGSDLQTNNATPTLENLSETVAAVVKDVSIEHVSGANLLNSSNGSISVFYAGGSSPGAIFQFNEVDAIIQPGENFNFNWILRCSPMSLSESEYEALAEEGVYVIESNPPQVVGNHKIIIEFENAPDVEFNFNLTIPISDSIEEEVVDEEVEDEEVVDEEVVEDPFVEYQVHYSYDGQNFNDSLDTVLVTSSNIVTINEQGEEVLGPSQRNIKVRVANLGNVPGNIYLSDLTEEFFDVALNGEGIKYTEDDSVKHLTHDDLPPNPTPITVHPEGFTSEDLANTPGLQLTNAVIFDFTIVYTPLLFADEQFAINDPNNPHILAERDFTLHIYPHDPNPALYDYQGDLGGAQEIKIRLIHPDVFPDGGIWNRWDVNQDGEIGSADLLGFLVAYGAVEGVDDEYNSALDSNSDGEIGSADLLDFLPNYGASFSDEDEDEDNDNNEQP